MSAVTACATGEPYLFVCVHYVGMLITCVCVEKISFRKIASGLLVLSFQRKAVGLAAEIIELWNLVSDSSDLEGA